MADAQKAESTPSPDGEGVRLAKELERLHNDARGCEFDLVPADGPIARLALFMHENGDQLAAMLRTAQNTGRDEVLLDVVDDLGVLDQVNPGDEHFRKQVRRLIEAYKARALSSPPVSTVDEEGGGA